jgi:pyrimidine-nucleoside phosphorylase
MTSPVEIIKRKRDGGSLEPEQIQALVRGLLSGEVTDYQMSAFLMAAYLRGMNDGETGALLQAMLHSGKVLNLGSVRAPKVDKHSTGGVGDKISLCLAPLVASAGVAVPMISGRGLGHTGGTLDKLEAIKGYRVDLSAARFERIVREVGLSMIGQTAEIAPADRAIYALRDVTGTVESIPLIVASILSKKLAAGLDGLVLDVKTGRGAFMTDPERAKQLARSLVRVGKSFGLRTVALVTDMSVPLGLTIGNALETREAVEVLRDAGPADVRELTLALGVEMLLVAGVERSRVAARKRLERALREGQAFERFLRMVRAHGGDTRVLEHPERWPRARASVVVKARNAGYVADIDALELGLVSVALGAGRIRAEDPVDPAAGIEILAPLASRVARGQPLARLHARSPRLLETALARALGAFRIAHQPPRPRPRLFARLG